jgi:hypothetical protein
MRKELRRQIRTDYTITDRKRERESNLIVVLCSKDTFKLALSLSGNKKCTRYIFCINNCGCPVSVFSASDMLRLPLLASYIDTADRGSVSPGMNTAVNTNLQSVRNSEPTSEDCTFCRTEFNGTIIKIGVDKQYYTHKN